MPRDAPESAATPYDRGVFRRQPGRPWRDVDIAGRHADGGWIIREIGKLRPGVFFASGDQVRVAGLVFEPQDAF